jgi:hypothetical protein
MNFASPETNTSAAERYDVEQESAPSAVAEYVKDRLPGAPERVIAIAEDLASLPEDDLDDLEAFVQRLRAERASQSAAIEAAAPAEEFPEEPTLEAEAAAAEAEPMESEVGEGMGGSPESGEAVSAGVAAETPAAEDSIESAAETIEQLKEGIREYEGDREGLVDLIRRLGAANTTNPGYIDGTSAGSISAERAASAVERGFGENVSMYEIQQAAGRVYAREAAAAAPVTEAEPVAEPVPDMPAEGGSTEESSMDSDTEDVPEAPVTEAETVAAEGAAGVTAEVGLESAEALHRSIVEFPLDGTRQQLIDLVRRLGAANGGIIKPTVMGRTPRSVEEVVAKLEQSQNPVVTPDSAIDIAFEMRVLPTEQMGESTADADIDTESGDAGVGGNEEASAAAEDSIESAAETIEQLKEDIKDYDGDREGLVDLIRRLGAANTTNPGYIDGTSAGSISAERAASAVERGFGENVSMYEIQQAAGRVYAREAMAAAPVTEAEPVAEPVPDMPAEGGRIAEPETPATPEVAKTVEIPPLRVTDAPPNGELTQGMKGVRLRQLGNAMSELGLTTWRSQGIIDAVNDSQQELLRTGGGYTAFKEALFRHPSVATDPQTKADAHSLLNAVADDMRL